MNLAALSGLSILTFLNLVLLDFQFKKATRQPIKPHEIKIAKKERARLITRYWEIYSGQELSLQT